VRGRMQRWRDVPFHGPPRRLALPHSPLAGLPHVGRGDNNRHQQHGDRRNRSRLRQDRRLCWHHPAGQRRPHLHQGWLHPWPPRLAQPLEEGHGEEASGSGGGRGCPSLIHVQHQHHHRRGSSRLGRRGKDKLRQDQEEEKTEPHPCRMRRANVGMVGPE
jgi:hypothetical protein